jgi:anion transporter
VSVQSRWLPTLITGGILCVAVLSPVAGFDPQAQRALCLAVFAAVVWTTQPVAIEYSSLAILLLFPALDLLSFQESFKPFARQTIWLVFAGMSLSVALTRSGLGERVAALILRYTGQDPFRIILALHVVGLAFAFLVPSGVVRVLFLMPIALAIAQRVSPDRTSPSSAADSRLNHAAIALSLLCSTYYGGCGVLTGSVPNMVVAGQLEAAGRIVYWGEWLQWMFPVIGLARTILCFGVIWLLFGRRMRLSPGKQQQAPSAQDDTHLSSTERRTLVLLLAGVALWASDVFHGLAPAYIGLVLVLMAFIPRWGVLQIEHLREVNFPFFFYLAALFSMGEALQQAGFSAWFMNWVEGNTIDFSQHGWLFKHLAITWLVVPLDFLMDIGAVAGVITPVMLDFGQGHGVAQLPAALCVGMATALVFLPYQAAPFMVALSYNRFTMRQLCAVMVIISTLSLIFLFPLNVLYWRWIGHI